MSNGRWELLFGNRVFNCLGYCKPWQYNIEKEARPFKTLHHINAPKKLVS